MNAVHPPSVLVGFALVAFIAWRLGVRVWRLTMRQPVRRWSLNLRILVWLIVLVALAWVNLSNASVLEALAGGCVLGVLAGWYGVRGSTFESTPEGVFYTPHRGVGALVAVLLLARIGYRVMQYMSHQGPSGAVVGNNPYVALGTTPLTTALIGLFAGYTVTYSVGVLRWRGAQASALPERT